MNSKLLIGAVVACIAYAATVARKHDEPVAIAIATSQEAPVTAATQLSDKQPDAAPKEEPPFVMGDIGDVALLAHVEHKYRFLIADANPELVEELRQRLLERESQVSLTAREQLDDQIARLLSADGFEYFQVLKNSDLEQHHLAEYTGGISNVAPLDARQERVVLDAKLRQKQRYSTIMRDLGWDRDTLSPAERKYAHERTSEALKRYLDEFLSEVSAALTPEQYTQLKNYETTEFDRELSRLQQKINAK